jgi:4-hydroxy-tetrahydrodipicolinate synthase
LAEINNVRYIKESSGDVKRVHNIQRTIGDHLSVICGAPNTALESFALGCRAWITGIMNVVPRSAKQLMRAVMEKKDLSLARCIYYRQILPLVDMMTRNNNPTGTIKAGVCLQGIEVGRPRRPGRGVSPAESAKLERLLSDIKQAEVEAEKELSEA